MKGGDKLDDITGGIINAIKELAPEKLKWIQEEVKKDLFLHNTEVGKYINKIIENITTI